MVYQFHRRLSAFLQFHCLLCKQPLVGANTVYGICLSCNEDLPYISNSCGTCGLPLPVATSACGDCLKSPPSYKHCISPFLYQNEIKALVKQYKYHHDKAICMALGMAFVDQSRPKIEAGPEINLVVPVPMHWRKNLLRQGNHTLPLAREIANRLDIPIDTRLVTQTKNVVTQKSLAKRARKKNLRHAFGVSRKLQGQHIALVDDVMTTGSTMSEIAKCLLEAGAESVSAWSVARTPLHHGS